MHYNIKTIKSIFDNIELLHIYIYHKWEKLSSFYFKVIIFFISISTLYLVRLFIKDTIALGNIIDPIIFIVFPLFPILKEDEFKK